MSTIEALASGLLQTTVQGSVAVLVVWAICRAIPRLPASAKCALWWLASAKLLVSLAVIELIGLPVIPAGLLRPAPAASPVPSGQPETLALFCGAGPCARESATDRTATQPHAASRSAAVSAATGLSSREALMLAM